MIDLYAWATPNSIKVPILLEEVGLAYSVKPINIRQGAQKTPDYLKLNRNGKVPVIVDHGCLFMPQGLDPRSGGLDIFRSWRRRSSRWRSSASAAKRIRPTSRGGAGRSRSASQFSARSAL